MSSPAISLNNLEITPAEVKSAIDRGEKMLLIDVREPWEFDLSRIEGAKLIPMGTIPANLQSLDTGDAVICYCHHGMRSLDVAAWLRGQGIETARSMAGGIDRWSMEIDPKVPRY
ncbi:MAG: rhodanese-like domain-containing protein [Candidatus Acidiferrum sp.]|jgi:rhodanese-related sulfurtransferase